MIDDIAADLRAIYPDAPRVLLDLVAARVVLGVVLRRYNAELGAFDDATRLLYRALDTSKLARLEGAVILERARVAASSAGDLLLLACRLVAAKRARYEAWQARRTRAAELRGEAVPPAYVMPEQRGDAWEVQNCSPGETPPPMAPLFEKRSALQPKPSAADSPQFLLAARATLRIWSRYYVLHCSH